MGKLTEKEIAFYAIRTGHIFQLSCDEPGCGNLIKGGELYTVVKSEARKDKLNFLGQVPTVVRCNSCSRLRHPAKEEVKVKGAGRKSKLVSQEVASTMVLNPVVRRTLINLIKASTTGLTKTEVKLRLLKKKSIRELKKSEVSSTIRFMKKLKLIQYKAQKYVLPKEKPMKKKGMKVAK